MKGERPGHSLQTTALVNEAYMRLVDYERMQWQNRAHFFAVSAQLMRRILVEHARRHNLKRGGGVQHVSLDEAALVGGGQDADLVALDDAMNGWRGSIHARCKLSKCASLADSASKRRPRCSKYRLLP
jgi:RNA polymerase sigma factor (TIGR02999 family)